MPFDPRQISPTDTTWTLDVEKHLADPSGKHDIELEIVLPRMGRSLPSQPPRWCFSIIGLEEIAAPCKQLYKETIAISGAEQCDH